MSPTILDQPPPGRCPACKGAWIAVDVERDTTPIYACLLCGRPPTAPPPPDLVHAEPDLRPWLRKGAGR